MERGVPFTAVLFGQCLSEHHDFYGIHCFVHVIISEDLIGIIPGFVLIIIVEFGIYMWEEGETG